MKNKIIQMIPAPSMLRAVFYDEQDGDEYEVPLSAMVLVEQYDGYQFFDYLYTLSNGETEFIGEDPKFLHFINVTAADTKKPLENAPYCPLRNGPCIERCAFLSRITIHAQTVNACRLMKER